MEKIILLKLGEIVLKGLNRKKFEDRLINNIRGVLKGEEYTYKNAQSTIYIFPKEKFDFDNAIEKLKKVFGIVSIVIAHELPKDMNKICEAAPILLKDLLKDAKTFKCESKRSDKSFELKSPEINLKLGEVILNAFPDLKVDVHNPEITVVTEIRDFGASPYGGQGRRFILCAARNVPQDSRRDHRAAESVKRSAVATG